MKEKRAREQNLYLGLGSSRLLSPDCALLRETVNSRNIFVESASDLVLAGTKGIRGNKTVCENIPLSIPQQS